MNNILEIKEVCKDFEFFNIKNLSFSLDPGYILGLVGENGAGKTTTIQMILNTISMSKGSIEVFGKDNLKYELDIKQDLGVVYDENYLMEDWKVCDVEKLISSFYKNWDSEVYNKYIKRFKLEGRKKICELSKGLSMKLKLAIALSHNAKLLILDEPTSGLDPVSRNELLGILQEYIKDGKSSVLFSTHITSDLEKIADYIVILVKGELFFKGTKEALIEKFSIIQGGNDDLSDKIKEYAIGLETSQVGFKALITAEKAADLGNHIIKGKPTIEEVLIYKGKDKDYE